MTSDFPGGDTIAIVTKAPTGETDSMGVAVTADSVVEVYGCTFETLPHGPVEEMSDTTSATERASAWLPFLPGVTDAINNTNFLRPIRPCSTAQRDYKVQGLPLVEYDLDGQPDHVWIVCEYRFG